APRELRLRRPDKEHDAPKRKARSRLVGVLHRFQTPQPATLCPHASYSSTRSHEPLLTLVRLSGLEPLRTVMIPDTNIGEAADAVPLFSAPYALADEVMAAGLLDEAPRGSEAERRIDAYARRLVEGIRGKAGGLGGIEDFLHAYSLSTKEGLALMVLAEALLRVPDAATADRLIEETLARARTHGELRYSFDMLGEGARTRADAERYFGSYAHAIDAIAAHAADGANCPGISVKFSALQPRFEAVSRDLVLAELVPEVLELARKAREHGYGFTVDA